MIGQLGLALLAGGLVGLERERRDRQAGLRTHMLVCAGSALITLVSLHLVPDGGDPGRIAAQIVTGIGFLGAGTIFRSGNSVSGLTTAAGLWTVAGIGMAIAAGGALLQLGLVTTALVYVVNHWLRNAEDRWLRRNQELHLTVCPGHDALASVLDELSRRGVDVRGMVWNREESEGSASVLLRFRVSSEEPLRGLVETLSGVDGIRSVDLG